jgi:hypothetical protein
MTSPYHFYFVFVPRRTSNLRKVRFGKVVVPCAHALGYFQNFISFALFDLSNRRSSKKSIFVSCSILTDFCTICVCLSITFFLSSFNHRTFKEDATVAYALKEFETESKE